MIVILFYYTEVSFSENYYVRIRKQWRKAQISQLDNGGRTKWKIGQSLLKTQKKLGNQKTVVPCSLNVPNK